MERDQFRHVSANFGGISRGPSRVDAHILADAPAQYRQPLMERCEAGLKYRIVRGCGLQHADAPHRAGLLRTRHQRPAGRGAAKQRDEIAPPHSITSSAIASSEGGIVRPSILAVGWLMTSSNLVDCSTGRSAGLVPLRIRPL